MYSMFVEAKQVYSLYTQCVGAKSYQKEVIAIYLVTLKHTVMLLSSIFCGWYCQR